MSKNHLYYLNTLEKLAISSEGAANAKLAACIVSKNQVVSFGFNRLKSHPFQKRFGKNSDAIFLHAETDAILNALKSVDVDDLRKSTLYVCRVKKINKKFCWGLAKPCEGCTRAIATFNIRNVIYTDDDGFKTL